MKNRDEISGVSVDYLMYAGYVTIAYFSAKMARVKQNQLKNRLLVLAVKLKLIPLNFIFSEYY